MSKIISGIAAYVIIAFLVFGWTYNHTDLCFHGPHPDTKVVGDWCWPEEWRVNNSGMAGVLWPVVGIILIGAVGWNAITQAAIYVTRWP